MPGAPPNDTPATPPLSPTSNPGNSRAAACTRPREVRTSAKDICVRQRQALRPSRRRHFGIGRCPTDAVAVGCTGDVIGR